MNTKRIRELSRVIDDLKDGRRWVEQHPMINRHCGQRPELLDLSNVVDVLEDVVKSIALKEIDRRILAAQDELRLVVAESGAP